MENQYLRDNVVKTSIKVFLGLCVLGYMSSLWGNSEEKHLIGEGRGENENFSAFSNVEQVTIPAIKKRVVLQPHCKPPSMETTLQVILSESFRCKPGDMNREKQKVLTVKKKKIRKSKSKTSESMVVYVAVGLLLVSLGAAILEVFKFVNQPTAKTKPTLNRSCSLADLTVMRHNRKELMRRDSVLEGTDSRGPSKLLDRHAPLYRRCSFPVGPGDCRHGYAQPESDHHMIGGGYGSRSSSRKTSVDVEGTLFPSQHRHSHIRLLHRH